MQLLFTRSNLISGISLLIIIALAGYFWFFMPRSQGVTTIIFGTEPNTISITWNDVRRACTGTHNGEVAEISPTLHVRCVR